MGNTTLLDRVEVDSNVSIYALVDPRTDEVRYVGKAVDPHRRFAAHLQGQSLTAKSRKNSWLKNLLAEGLEPRLEILDGVESGFAGQAEIDWIKFFRIRDGEILTNGTDGGEGGAVTDPAAKARMGFRGRHSDATRRKMSDSHKKRCADPVERERLKSISNDQPPIRRGADVNLAVLDEDDVCEIRRLSGEGITGVELARRFGVTPQNISYIIRRQTWQHVTDSNVTR